MCPRRPCRAGLFALARARAGSCELPPHCRQRDAEAQGRVKRAAHLFSSTRSAATPPLRRAPHPRPRRTGTTWSCSRSPGRQRWRRRWRWSSAPRSSACRTATRRCAARACRVPHSKHGVRGVCLLASPASQGSSEACIRFMQTTPYLAAAHALPGPRRAGVLWHLAINGSPADCVVLRMHGTVAADQPVTTINFRARLVRTSVRAWACSWNSLHR